MTKHLNALAILGIIVRRLLGGAVVLPIFGFAAHANILFSGWYATSISAGPGESADVIEGIAYDTVPGVAGNAYDYIFDVVNTGPVPLVAFGGGTGGGAANAGVVIYSSDAHPAFPGLPASVVPVNQPAAGLPITQQPPAGFHKRLPGGWGGANNPFLGRTNLSPYAPLFPGASELYSPNYQYWGFEVSQAGAGYELGWYTLPGRQIFKQGLVTRFDLNSTLGPVAGGAFMDPPYISPSDYFIDWNNGDSADLLAPSIPDPAMYNCVSGTQGIGADCSIGYDGIPNEIASYAGYGVPEPASISLLAVAFLGVLLIGATARRSAGRHFHRLERRRRSLRLGRVDGIPAMHF